MTVEQSGGALPSEVRGEVITPQDVVRSPLVLLGAADAAACGPDGCALPV